MPKSWKDTKPNTRVDWRELVELYQYKKCTEQEFNHVRCVGEITSAVIHWIKITNKEGKQSKFPIVCCGYDPETELINEGNCPACLSRSKGQKFYLQNAIIRQLQEDKPARAKSIEEFPEEMKRKFRQKDDKSWSPIRVLKIPSSAAGQLRDIVKLNKHKIEGSIECMDVSDPKYGCDVFIKYDSNEAPASMYNVQRGEASPLTAEEKTYKLFDLNIVKPEPEKAEKDLLNLGHLKPSQAQYTKADETPDLAIDESDELPPAIEEEFEEKPRYDEKILKMSRKELIAYVKANGLQTHYSFKSSMSDDEIRAGIVKAEEKKKGDGSTCFGSYEGTEKCFECKKRAECVDSTSE